MSLEMFPPLALVSIRYILSGALLVLFARAKDMHLPRGRELWAACFSGFLTLGIGNGALVFSETLIPSGLAATLTGVPSTACLEMLINATFAPALSVTKA